MAPPKVLEAYTGEAVWLPNPPEAKRQCLHGQWPSMARVVVALLRQCDDQLKIGLPWIEVHILPLVTN
jgi:hypothetical protein